MLIHVRISGGSALHLNLSCPIDRFADTINHGFQHTSAMYHRHLCKERHMKTITKSVVIALFLFGSLAHADALLINKIQQDAQTQIERPSRGMSKATVASRFGEPKDKVAAVGTP